MGTQETIIYRLVVRNPSNGATLGGKMGVATTGAPNGLGSRNPAKKLAQWVDLLGQLLSRNHVLKIFKSDPPLICETLYIRRMLDQL